MATLGRKLSTARRLSWSEHALAAEAAVALALARLVTSLLPFGLYARWMRADRAGVTPSDTLIRDVRQAVGRAARNVPWASVCLPEAMAAKALLARRGYPSRLHLGLRQSNGKVSAHAWLEANGRLVTGQIGAP